jgi:CheY-like chemotaxis protein
MIVILEDDERRRGAMEQALAERRLDATFFDNAPALVAWLESHLPEVRLPSLDHDLIAPGGSDPGNGRDVTDWLCGKPPSCPVLLHTSNPIGRDGMRDSLEAAAGTVDFVSPFDDLEWVALAWIRRVSELVR